MYTNTEKKFTIEDALAIQAEHLAFYKETLKPQYYAIIEKEVLKRNKKGYKSAYDVCRGSDIDNIYGNIVNELRNKSILY